LTDVKIVLIQYLQVGKAGYSRKDHIGKPLLLEKMVVQGRLPERIVRI
jgi:hypothetical protein